MAEHDLTPTYGEWLRTVDVGSEVRLHQYKDGWWRVSHLCKMIDSDDRIRSAPELTRGGHVIVSTDPLTISPSILCTDCGLHGFVTDGRWVGA